MFFQAAFEFLSAIQTEIAIFIIAVSAHQLLFGKHGIATKSSKQASAKQLSPAGQPPSASGGAILAQTVKHHLRSHSDRKQLIQKLTERLEADTQKDASTKFADMLQIVGKAATASVLDAVREVMRDCGFSPDSRLTELLLRSYFGMGMYSEFNDVLEGAQKAGVCTKGAAALAVRAAVAKDDFEAALERATGLAQGALDEEAANSPSAAPRGAVQQLAQLAVKQAKLPALLGGLRAKAPHLAPAALEAALAAAAKAGGEAAAREAEELARAAGVELTAAARCALLRTAADGACARRLFTKAPDADCTPDLLLAAADAAVAHGNMALAKDVLRKVPGEPAPEAAVALLRLHCEGLLAASDARILELWEKRPAGADLLPEPKAARRVAEACFRLQRPDVLGQLLSPMPVGPGHVALLKGFGGDGSLEKARRIFEACPEHPTLLHNALLDACVGCKDVEAAESVMAQAVAENMVDAVTYNTMIKKHLQRGDIHLARAAIETMKAAGGSLAPNCVTFNEFIDAAIRTSTKAAWDLVEEMKACGLQPNSVTCSTLLKGVQRNSPAADVERALAMALEGQADEVLVSSVCEACIRAGRADLLQRALRRLRVTERVAVTGTHTFGSLVRAYGFLGDLAGAWATWKEMWAADVVPTSTTMGCMVEALAANGDPEAAHRLVRELSADERTRPLLNPLVYGSVLKGFSHGKQYDRVWAVHKEMQAAGMEPALSTYNALLDNCARSGQLAKIPSLLQDMARLNIAANLVTYSTVLKAYCQEGRLERAFEIFEEMKACKHMQPDEIVYNTLIDGCARNCLFDRGMKLLQEMQQRGVRPSAYTVSVLVKLASRCKRPQQAAALCNELARKYNIRLNVHVHNNLVCAWTQQGAMREAFEALECMLRDGACPDVRTYTMMLRGCLAAGDAGGAAGLLRAAAGLRGAHARISSFDPKKLQPHGGLPVELQTEVIEGISSKCGDERLAQQLLWDLRGARGTAKARRSGR